MASDRLPEAVRTPRLLLRRWTPADADLLSGIVARNLEHLRPWMPWAADEPMTRAERLAMLEGWEDAWQEGGDAVMAIVYRDLVIGGTGLHPRQAPDGLEIGYWVDRDHLGRGFATEAAGALTTAAFEVEGVGCVEIHHDRANVRSAAVPARLGYRLIGTSSDAPAAPGEDGVHCAWRVTRTEWAAIGAAGRPPSDRSR